MNSFPTVTFLKLVIQCSYYSLTFTHRKKQRLGILCGTAAVGFHVQSSHILILYTIFQIKKYIKAIIMWYLFILNCRCVFLLNCTNLKRYNETVQRALLTKGEINSESRIIQSSVNGAQSGKETKFQCSSTEVGGGK